MKPVVSTAQIAAQAYAQSTVQPKPRGPTVGQPRFHVDPQKASENGPTSFRRIQRETDAFKIEISAEALAASEREAGGQRVRLQLDARGDTRVDDVEAAEKADALVAFRAVDPVSGGVGRREAPFAQGRVTKEPEPVRRPGSLLDITV
ncbi:MAG: hypothetical protein RLN89_07055 [Parvibaculum sp.]